MASDPKIGFDIRVGDFPDPSEDSATLTAKAERCRRLAAGISDKQASDVLTGMARGYQDAAERLKGANPTV
ncbi:hypothetical protein GCM10022211_22900 [Sphingomonas humi]|uniref:ESX-1 secretion-associated protein n=1 Tax=Sphingomonas humi TaxID=335630 RepID=A0ABP7SA97_9SPHN